MESNNGDLKGSQVDGGVMGYTTENTEYPYGIQTNQPNHNNLMMKTIDGNGMNRTMYRDSDGSCAEDSVAHTMEGGLGRKLFNIRNHSVQSSEMGFNESNPNQSAMARSVESIPEL